MKVQRFDQYRLISLLMEMNKCKNCNTHPHPKKNKNKRKTNKTHLLYRTQFLFFLSRLVVGCCFNINASDSGFDLSPLTFGDNVEWI